MQTGSRENQLLMMVLSQLMCVTATFVLLEGSLARVSADMVPPLQHPPRHLEEAAVKVHVEVHSRGETWQPSLQDAIGPSLKHHKAIIKEESSESGKIVQSYRHGTVRIDAKARKKHGTDLLQKESANQKQTGEAVVEYERGSVKISGSSTPNAKIIDREVSTQNEKEVTVAAKEVDELVTKLSSTETLQKSSLIKALESVGATWGVIGVLAAIVGVAGFAMRRLQSTLGNQESALCASNSDIDVEANVSVAGEVEDVTNDREDLKNSRLEAADGDDEKSNFASGTDHGSV